MDKNKALCADWSYFQWQAVFCGEFFAKHESSKLKYFSKLHQACDQIQIYLICISGRNYQPVITGL